MTSLFIDTNVFVYAESADESQKHARALEVLEATRKISLISAQVIAEFISAMTKRSADREVRAYVTERARQMVHTWPMVPIGSTQALVALGICESHQISYWDSQICAAALISGCKAIITEDARDPIECMLRVITFTESFDVAALG